MSNHVQMPPTNGGSGKASGTVGDASRKTAVVGDGRGGSCCGKCGTQLEIENSQRLADGNLWGAWCALPAEYRKILSTPPSQGDQANVPAGTTRDVTVETQKPVELLCAILQNPNAWVINQITFADETIIIGGPGVPGEFFAHDVLMCGFCLYGRVLVPGQKLIFRVTNVTNEDLPFNMGIGTSLKCRVPAVG
jgi:hypothetical protein